MTPEKHKENTIRAMLLDARKLGIIVDPTDEDLLVKYSWGTCGRDRKYIARMFHTENGRKLFYLHRIIAERAYGEIADGLYVDHINRNTKDNRRENLRLVTNSLNNFHRPTSKRGISQWPSGRYSAVIKYMGKQYHSNFVDTYEEALAIRKAMEIKYFGELQEKENP